MGITLDFINLYRNEYLKSQGFIKKKSLGDTFSITLIIHNKNCSSLIFLVETLLINFNIFYLAVIIFHSLHNKLENALIFIF